jgi:hypothetical protein
MFLNPWAIAIGVLAAGLPFLVHWLTRPKPVRVSTSTLRFLREVVRQQKTRHRLRDFLILSTRVLAVVLFCLALSRPHTGSQSTVVEEETADTVRVVILDISQSMGTIDDGVAFLDRARVIAADQLEYRRGLKANLVLAGSRAHQVFASPSSNFGALRDSLEAAVAKPQRLDINAALRLAATMLIAPADEGESGPRRELVIISDFQRANWSVADFGVVSGDVEIDLHEVHGKETPTNVGITDVGLKGRVQAGKPSRLEVRVGNYSPDAGMVRVEVVVDGAIHHLEQLCQRYSETILTKEILISEDGWISGQARLLRSGPAGSGGSFSDSLPSDDWRPFAQLVAPPPLYAILTRDDKESVSSSYFLERALAPYDSAETEDAASIVRVDPLQTDRLILDSADLIVLDHPGEISDELMHILGALLRRGRGVLYIASEDVDATNLRLLLEESGGLQLPVEFSPASVGQPRRDLFVADMQESESPLNIFGDALAPLVAPLRFSGGLASRRVPASLEEDVLVTLNDQSALLVRARSEHGGLIVLNAELMSSNLAQSPIFVPWVNELAQLVIGSRGGAEAAVSGQPLGIYLPATIRSDADLTVSRFNSDEAGSGVDVGVESVGHVDVGDGDEQGSEFTTDSNGVFWRAKEVGPPGVLTIERNGQTVFSLACVMDAEESDLRTITQDVLQDRLAKDRVLRFHDSMESGEKVDRLWASLAVACVVMLLLELVLLKGFRT